MTDSNKQFEQQVHDAYERIELSEDAQNRMLGALLMAQSQRAETGSSRAENLAGSDTDVSVHHQSEVNARTAKPADPTLDAVPADSKVVKLPPKRMGWKVILPIAAVLAAALIIVRVQTTSLSTAKNDSTEATVAYEEAETGNYEDQLSADETGAMQDMESVSDDTAKVTDAESANAGTDLPSVFCCLELSDGMQLTVVLDTGQLTEVPADDIGALVGEGQAKAAFDADDIEAVSCEVYELNDESGRFAVRYAGEETYWLCGLVQ